MSGNLKSTPEDRAAVLGNSWHGDGYKAPTPAVVDHVEDAERIILRDKGPDYQLGYETADAQHIMNMLEAQVHATLALVEQQKLGNLIAYLAVSQDRGARDAAHFDLDHLVQRELGL